jgi:hypothetical protein
MTSGGPVLRRLVRRCRLGLPWPSSCLLGVLLSSQVFLALKCKAPMMILEEVASRYGFTWWLSIPTWGVDVDELAYPLL